MSDTLHRTVAPTLVIGAIRWCKTLGRPDTPALSDGFNIDALTFISIDRGPALPPQVTPKELTVSAWDGPHDDKDWIVLFTLGGILRGFPTRITPRFKNVPWGGIGQIYKFRVFEPPFVDVEKPDDLGKARFTITS
jgi:hypothetical protein